MDKNIVLGVVALVAVSIGVLLMLPDNSEHSPDTLPWAIKHPTPDAVQVFKITLGQSTLEQAEQVLKEPPEISLFKSPEGKMNIEAFFEELNLNGLKAKFILSVDLPSEQLQKLYERGARMNGTPSGKRITLQESDLGEVRKGTVTSLTYLPTIQLSDAVISKRFGEPTERIREKDSGAVHWLYPANGLDITLSEREKPLFQYVQPRNFDLLRAPLLKHGELVK